MFYVTPKRNFEKATIEIEGDGIFYIRCPYELKNKATQSGGKWIQKKKAWMYALTPSVIKIVKEKFGDDLITNPTFEYLYAKKKRLEKDILKYREEAENDIPIDFSVDGVSLNGNNPLYNYQKWGIKCSSSSTDGFLIGDVMGLGKGLWKETNVLTPNGKKKIGELKIGDYVIGKNGKKSTVTGFFPQGFEDIYKVTFNDGCYVYCDKYHLWSVKDIEEKSNEWITLSVEQLIDNELVLNKDNRNIKTYYKNKNGDSKWAIPVVNPVEFCDDENLMIDPYLLGKNLANVNVKDNDNICYHKGFIPHSYKYSSIDNRIKLLQGIMDYSEVKINDNIEIIYQSCHKKLLNDISYLIQSLGGICIFNNKEDGKYCLRIKLPKEIIPFSDENKLNNYNLPENHEILRYIVNIEKLKEQKECVCISVDSEDKLYVIENFLVTHNTIQGIGTAINRNLNGEVNSCLIVCPASLKYNWESEIKKFTNKTVLVIDGNKQERTKKWIAENYFFKIVNYELLMMDLFHDVNAKKSKERIDQRIDCADFIVNNYFDMIILDEIHYIKSHNALRTKAVKNMKCKYRLGLTGTPVDGRLEELHSIFEFLKPGLFPSKMRFIEKYAILDYFGSIKGYKNIGEVKEKIRPFYIRRLKEKVLKDLPEKIFTDLHVELDSKCLKEYKKIASRKHEITKEKAAIEAIIRCRQFCDFPELLDLRLPSAKFARLHELLDELVHVNHEKVIIFTQYKTTLDLLEMNLKDEYDLSFIHGGINDAKERFKIVEEFNKNPKKEIIIMTDAGAAGLNIQSANNVIHYDDNYSPAVMLQRVGRCDRIGQKKVVTVYRFICKDTIEERVREVLDKKQAINNGILDEENNELSLGGVSTMEILDCL